MVLNDFFDRAEDARDRPERPIPSGQVSARTAGLLGFGLLGGGVLAAASAGRAPLVVAAALALAIVAYDAALKATLLGPPTMGLCRLLNVALGLSVAADGSSLRSLPVPAVVLPLALGLYTCVLTLLARDEVHGASPRRVRALVGCFVALGVGYVIVLAAGAPAGLEVPALVFFAYLLARAAAVFMPVWRSGEAMAVRKSIGGGILLMPLIDAAAVAAAGYPVVAAILIVLGVPAQILRRRIAMS
jgi:4-hydroxybenzoate polyprenyltransferase